jgi:hypothetical protein
VRHTQHWNFGTYWLQLLVPVDLFLLSALALPERDENGTIDLGAWYFHNRAWFFGIMFFLPLLSIAEELARSGRMASTPNLAFLLLFDVVIVVALILRSRKQQEWITVGAMLLTVIYVALLFSRLPA